MEQTKDLEPLEPLPRKRVLRGIGSIGLAAATISAETALAYGSLKSGMLDFVPSPGRLSGRSDENLLFLSMSMASVGAPIVRSMAKKAFNHEPMEDSEEDD